jgi:hypothetical protein
MVVSGSSERQSGPFAISRTEAILGTLQAEEASPAASSETTRRPPIPSASDGRAVALLLASVLERHESAKSGPTSRDLPRFRLPSPILPAIPTNSAFKLPFPPLAKWNLK